MNNNKGATLAYAVMAMLLVFALCALITTVTLTQVTYSNSYLEASETQRNCNQIGDLFCDTSGDYFYDGDDSAELSPFAIALTAARYTVTDNGSFWTASIDEYSFTLNLSNEGTLRTLKISDESGIMLTVMLNTGEETEILVFNKGE